MRPKAEISGTHSVTVQRELRTGSWYGDSPIHLDFPARWRVITHWPQTPPPLSYDQIRDSLERPAGQPPIRELAKGKVRPLILVDDLNRPTPAASVIDLLLKQFEAAGISAAKLTILIARGSHGEPQQESMRLKVGSQAAARCRVLLHDPYRDTVKLGATSFGTSVRVSKHVAQADFLVGIGGVYPNHTAGFGGGAKLAMGVLDIRVISQLHSKHSAAGWGSICKGNTFRQDLEEIASIIGLGSLILGHVDAARELVRLRSGDYHLFYDEEVAFARQAFHAPKPGRADVVIANAFPNDLSLTFVHMKGVHPLRYAVPAASRIVLAACSEGEGFHGVFPVVHKSRLHEQFHRLRRISRMSVGEIGKKVVGRVGGRFTGNGSAASPTAAAAPKNPIWLYRTGTHADILPSPVKGIRTVSDWQQILDIVRQEQGGRQDLNVVVYPCAPLQILE